MLAARIGVDDVGIDLRFGKDGFRPDFAYNQSHSTPPPARSTCRAVIRLVFLERQRQEALPHHHDLDRRRVIAGIGIGLA